MSDFPLESSVVRAIETGGDVTAPHRRLLVSATVGSMLVVGMFLLPCALSEDSDSGRWAPTAFLGVFFIPMVAYAIAVGLDWRAYFRESECLLVHPFRGEKHVAWSAVREASIRRNGIVELQWEDGRGVGRIRLRVGPSNWSQRVVEAVASRIQQARRSGTPR